MCVGVFFVCKRFQVYMHVRSEVVLIGGEAVYVYECVCVCMDVCRRMCVCKRLYVHVSLD